VDAAAALDDIRRRGPSANSRLGLEWLLTGMAAAMRAGAAARRTPTG